MASDPSPEEMVFLSTMPAGPGHRRLALAVVLIAATLFFIGLPFASVQLPTVWAFIPMQHVGVVLGEQSGREEEVRAEPALTPR